MWPAAWSLSMAEQLTFQSLEDRGVSVPLEMRARGPSSFIYFTYPFMKPSYHPDMSKIKPLTYSDHSVPYIELSFTALQSYFTHLDLSQPRWWGKADDLGKPAGYFPCYHREPEWFGAPTGKSRDSFVVLWPSPQYYRSCLTCLTSLQN